MEYNYLNKSLLFFMVLFFSSFGPPKDNPLKDSKWIITFFNNPYNGKPTYLINADSNKVDCSTHYTLNFTKNGRLIVNLNNKISSKGNYKIVDTILTLNPQIDLKFYDTSIKCKLTTENRIILTEILCSVKSFHINHSGKLQLFFDHPKTGISGEIFLNRVE